MTRVRAITFDLWDTLIQEVPENSLAMLQYRMEEIHAKLETLGHRHDIEDIERAYRLSREFCEQVWVRKRDIPLDDHLLFMLSCIDTRLPSRLGSEGLELIRNIYKEALLRYPPILFDDVKQTLEKLSKRGYKLGMISNTGRTPGEVLRRLLSRMKIEHYFASMTFSNEIFVRKPDCMIFRHTLSNMHIKPRFSVHVGDNRSVDYEGARAAGMIAIIIDRNAGGKYAPDTIHSLGELVDIFQ